ncbi:MAG TPA: hypothetical protein DEP32_05910 [Pseudomonas sp.]|jgi:hypothetical protein|nr:hypothetical protein [Pseudomonadales bacterium]MAQ50676.1 hypothetical protein [Pseudomonas sp.]MBB50619.1 hypothetical protein [Pseudomonadales bacterium]MBF77990.1 hypothetical protein [Pseudomonadales bacterium]MBU31754.1 hypothetical protein [Pseudomonadales bacterium]|tara:strand:+ start:1215 stop:1922 length:708 start_codon:yes stop_codon:yes gene_type:complete
MMHIAASPRGARLLGAGAVLGLLQACSTTPTPDTASTPQIERELLSHSLHIETGEPLVMDTPHRSIRVTESRLFSIRQYDAQGTLQDEHRQYQTLPWADRTLTIQLGELAVTRQTDSDGQLRLNLLDEDIVPVDFDQLRVIELDAQATPEVRAEATLLIDRDLRSVLHEASELIYDNLEEDEVSQWVDRIERLRQLGLKEEASQLENMLILLTTGDPQLQGDFVQALDNATTPQE